jgi:curved DNA-binding protein CbpA
MVSNRLDYYALLGIDRSASGDEIGRAYRRAARATHPDTHPDEPSAGERFTAIAVAYETLSDPARRASYDQHRPPTTRAYRVEPVASREAQPSVVPIRPRPNPEPLRTPDAMRIEGPETIEELAASLSLLLHWTRRSF